MNKLKPRFARVDTSSKNLKQVLRIIDGKDEFVPSIENITFQKGANIQFTEPSRYRVKLSGKAFDKDADPSIEKDLGIKAGYHYFVDKDKKDEFINMIVSQKKYTMQGVIIQSEGYYDDDTCK